MSKLVGDIQADVATSGLKEQKPQLHLGRSLSHYPGENWKTLGAIVLSRGETASGKTPLSWRDWPD